MRALFIKDKKPRTPLFGHVATLATFLAYVACAPVDSPALPAPARAASNGCAMSGSDYAWLERSLEAWRFTRDEILKRDDDRPPTFVVYDATCAWTTSPGARVVDVAAPIGDWTAGPHRGSVALPDGGSLPPQVASFAAPIEGGVMMVMGLPSVWHAGGVESEIGLETLMTAVFLHEMAHAYQFDAFAPLLDGLEATWDRAYAFDDDAVQNRYEGVPDFVAAYERERDRLYDAVRAADPALERGAARSAWGMMQARRLQWYVGLDAEFKDIESAFLTLEGVGQWAGFAWLTHPDGGGVAFEDALTAWRRGGAKWSQDEGLAMFLVIDRLDPTWVERAFGDEPVFAGLLLSQALAAPPRDAAHP